MLHGARTCFLHAVSCSHTQQKQTTAQRLHAVKGLSEAKAEKMLEAARKVTSCGEWSTGTDVMIKVC
jgi:hypothetical protein